MRPTLPETLPRESQLHNVLAVSLILARGDFSFASSHGSASLCQSAKADYAQLEKDFRWRRRSARQSGQILGIGRDETVAVKDMEPATLG
jgi:hypothetical protein